MKKSLFDKSEELLLRKVVLKSPHYKAGHEGIIKYWYSGINVYFIELDDNSSTTVSRHDEMDLISKRKIDLRFSVWKPNIDKIMKLLILLLFSVSSFAQDTITLHHTNYKVLFSKSKHIPIVCTWWETKAKVGCSNKIARVNSFGKDPLLPNETNVDKYYDHAGFDRGHLNPCEANLCQGVNIENECFFLSNICPQYAALNRGSWKSLETLCINWTNNMDSIKVWAGNIGEIAKIKGVVSVPKYCFKIVYIVKQKQFKAYLFTNSKDDSVNKNPESTVENIEQLTGLTFKP